MQLEQCPCFPGIAAMKPEMGAMQNRVKCAWRSGISMNMCMIAQEAEADRRRLLRAMRAWSAALRPRYTSEFKPTGLCWLPPASLPKQVPDGLPLQQKDHDRMVNQVGQRYVVQS
jgi:hypothetical protein